MSRSTQDKVMAAFETAAEDYELELIVDKRFSNVGLVRFEDPSEFDDVALSFSFDFNTDSWHLGDISPHLPGFRLDEERFGKRTQSIGVWTSGHGGVTASQVIKAIRNHLAARRAKLLEEELAR